MEAREVPGRDGDGIADPIPGRVGIISLPVPKDTEPDAIDPLANEPTHH